MSRQLQIASMPAQEAKDYIPVHWRLDKTARQGIVNVRVDPALSDRHIIAELCALRYLIVDRERFGSNSAPKGSVVTVTSGAIKKLRNKDSEKGGLVPYGRFLYLALDGAELTVDKVASWGATLPVHEIHWIDASFSFLEIAHAHALNCEISVSRHAIERYQERNGTASARKALHGIRRLLSNETTRRMSVSEAKRFKALLRHWKDAELLLHADSDTVFVIVPEGQGSVLATVIKDDSARRTEQVQVGGRIETRYRWRAA